MHVAGLNMAAHPPEAATVARAFRMHTPPKLTYFSTVHNRNGTERRVTISLPYVRIIASEPDYTAPPPLPEPSGCHRACASMERKTHSPIARQGRQAHRLAAQPRKLRGDDAKDRRRRRVNYRIVMVSDVSPRSISPKLA